MEWFVFARCALALSTYFCALSFMTKNLPFVPRVAPCFQLSVLCVRLRMRPHLYEYEFRTVASGVSCAGVHIWVNICSV